MNKTTVHNILTDTFNVNKSADRESGMLSFSVEAETSSGKSTLIFAISSEDLPSVEDQELTWEQIDMSKTQVINIEPS